MLSRSLNLTWLSPIYRGPMVETRSTRTAQDLGHMHSANSCAAPCFAGNRGMYQQSSFLVNPHSSPRNNPLKAFICCSDATILCSHQQSSRDDRPIYLGLAYCFKPIFTVEFTRNEATNCPCSTCVVRGPKIIAGYYDSSFHRVRCLSPDSHPIYLFESQDWTKP